MGLLGSIILGLAGLGGGALAFFGAKKAQQTNQNIAVENMQMQQTENEIARQREDNAVQRRAADLEAAGISKYLAAGSAASSQAMTAPKNEFQAENLGQAALQGISQGTQIAQQVANVQNTVAQTKAQQLANDTYMEKHYADLDVKKAESRLANASANVQEIVGSYKAKEIESLIDSRIEGILKSSSDRMVNDSVIELNSAKLMETLRHTDLYQREAEKYAYDMILENFKIKAEEHNLEVAKKFGLPVGSMPGGLFGGAFSTGIASLNLVKNTLSNNVFSGNVANKFAHH